MAKQGVGAKVLNVVYGVAAAIVILGALFKIMHWPYASEVLIVGMLTEVVIFAISAFDFPKADYEWERVYPQLSDPNYIPDGSYQQSAPVDTSALSSALKNMDAGVFGALSDTLSGLNTNVGKLSSVADAAGATNAYAAAIQGATTKIETMNKSYEVSVGALGNFANAASDASQYQEEVKKVTKNLQTLNGVYEVELQNANTHVKSLNQFYGAMSAAMSSMVEASKDAESYKNGMAQLNGNLTKLNGIYSNMLTAMAGGAK